MSERTKDFIPAAGTDWLLPLYDPVDHLLRGGPQRSAYFGRPGTQRAPGCSTSVAGLARSRS